MLWLHVYSIVLLQSEKLSMYNVDVNGTDYCLNIYFDVICDKVHRRHDLKYTFFYKTEIAKLKSIKYKEFYASGIQIKTVIT